LAGEGGASAASATAPTDAKAMRPCKRGALSEGDSQQARAKQHKAGCGYREKSFGYEIVVTHDAPADRDVGPNLLKFSESFPLQHRPRTIAFISVRNENAGADEAEKPCNHLDHRKLSFAPSGDRNDRRGRTVKRISTRHRKSQSD
jgi:hypothetical protein